MINLENMDLERMLRGALIQTEEDAALSHAITAMLKDIFQKSKIINPLEMPEFLLDLIAWEEHVDFYDTSLSVQQKRELIERSDFFHKQKGTPAAIEELITIIFGDGKVVEWFEYGGQPYHFKVVTSNPSATVEKALQFAEAVNSVKNLRSILEKVEITTSEKLTIYFAGVVHSGDKITIKQVI